MRTAAHLIGAAAALATMSCALLPAEYEPDAGPAAPPYIVPLSEDPPFESTLQYSAADSDSFKVTVGDADLARVIQVRFCLRANADVGSPYLLAVNPELAEPTPNPTVERTPVVVDIAPCNRFASNDETHFLYVIVAAKADFVGPENGCDVTPGAGYTYAFWRFTCDKPQ